MERGGWCRVAKDSIDRAAIRLEVDAISLRKGSRVTKIYRRVIRRTQATQRGGVWGSGTPQLRKEVGGSQGSQLRKNARHIRRKWAWEVNEWSGRTGANSHPRTKAKQRHVHEARVPRRRRLETLPETLTKVAAMRSP